MKLVVEGVMEGSLPWNLILIGVGSAIMFEILGLPVLAVAIGIYLPIHLSLPTFAGGLVRALVDKKETEGKMSSEKGILFSSGLIAGEGLIGILLAVFAIIPLSTNKSLLDTINMGGILGNVGGIVFFGLLIASFVFFVRNKNKNGKN